MRRRFRLKDIKSVVKPNGRRYLYRRVGKDFVPLPDLPENHPDFIAAYLAATEGKPRAGIQPARTGTIAELCDKYIKSREFKSLSKSTQQSRGRIIAKIRDERGSGLLSDLRTDHIRKDVRKLTSGAASNRLKSWRGIFGYAVDEGMLLSDPSRGVKVPRSDGDGHRQWTKDEIAKFRTHWPNGSKERIAFEVIFWTGARCSDAASLGDTMLDENGWLTFTQEKTGGTVTLPVHASLPNWARSLSSDQKHLLENLPSAATWITTQHSKPRSAKSLSAWLSERATMAGLAKDCTAHGLRKARAASLAEAGATTHQIGAWTGHRSLSKVTHYTRQADLRAILSGAENT